MNFITEDTTQGGSIRWRICHVAFDTTDPLFDFSNVIESGGNAATVDEITYSGEAAT